MKEPLLSICIPTYNRSRFLGPSLTRIKKEISDMMDVELIISDNCSSDGTQELVQQFIAEGLRCKYVRNSENLGADGNFLQCFHLASGKYVWLLGDDDYMKVGCFARFYNLLASGEYGLVSMHMERKKKPKEYVVFNDSGLFISEVGVWTTFISGNIFRREIVEKVDGDLYRGTNLIQVPYYLASALTTGLPNVIYYPRVLENGADTDNNGGFCFFKVFCENLFTIYLEHVDRGLISKRNFRRFKRRVYCRWMYKFYRQFFVDGDSGNYKIEDGKAILKKWYGRCLYFHAMNTVKTFARKFQKKRIKK